MIGSITLPPDPIAATYTGIDFIGPRTAISPGLLVASSFAIADIAIAPVT
jgi:hypothetical protein